MKQRKQVSTVFFDIGYTLADENRLWGLWADWLGVPRDEFFAELDGVIARREHHRRVFDRFAKDFDVDAAKQERRVRGWPSDVITLDDFYPDALPCLRSLKAAGFRIGLSGNQPTAVEEVLRTAGVPADIVGSSERWGVSKPDPRFFARVAEEAGVPAGEIAYVGDRVDNDVLPALEAGMVAVFLPRGPWGIVQARWPEAAKASLRIESLAELPHVIPSAARDLPSR